MIAQKLIRLAFLFILFIHCSSNSSDNKKNNDTGTNSKERTNLEYLQLLINSAIAPGSLQFSPCVLYSMPLNWLYFAPGYYYRFHADTTQYEFIIVGDSSMDYSSWYPGFLGPTSQSVAVQGNKLCDMVTQLPAINTVSPSAIIVGTMGGNDILDGIPNIYESQAELFYALRQKFPNAKIIALGIPPSESLKLNKLKNTANASAYSSLQMIYPPSQFCFVDPQIIFGSSPDPLYFFDQIHYSPLGAFLIKGLVQNMCGVTF